MKPSRKPRIVAEIEARAASSRLPRKIFADIAGRDMLGRVLDAARAVPSIDDIVVATTVNPLDDETQRWCEHQGVRCYRGSESDVLHRVAGAVEQLGADIVVELTGDNPLGCPEVIEQQLKLFLSDGCDYVGDNIDPTYPVGCGAKIFRARMLHHLNGWTDDPYVREHVSLYFYEHPERYRIGTLRAPADLAWPELRVTVDTEADLAFARAVWSRAGAGPLRYEQLVRIVRAEGLDVLNRTISQKPARYGKAALCSAAVNA